MWYCTILKGNLTVVPLLSRSCPILKGNNSLHFKKVMSMKLCILGLYSKENDSQNASKQGSLVRKSVISEKCYVLFS